MHVVPWRGSREAVEAGKADGLQHLSYFEASQAVAFLDVPVEIRRRGAERRVRPCADVQYTFKGDESSAVMKPSWTSQSGGLRGTTATLGFVCSRLTKKLRALLANRRQESAPLHRLRVLPSRVAFAAILLASTG
jgi:hypothetical protein